YTTLFRSSFIGYVREEITVGTRTRLDVVLKTDNLLLNETVIVGYGEVKKSDLTGAVSSLQPSDIVRGNPPMAAKAIQGQIAGATVTKSSNRPGAGYGITIRGENTINFSTQPLDVIDGLMTSEQFYKATYTDRIAEGAAGATFTATEMENIQNGRTTDWVDLITEPALQTSQNISVSGGNDKTTYRFSGGYLQENGNVLHT